MGKKVTRERVYFEGELVTVLERGRRKSTIRTAHGFVKHDIPNKELDKIEPADDDEPDVASFEFETPSASR